jgi:hypothetical protein
MTREQIQDGVMRLERAKQLADQIDVFKELALALRVRLGKDAGFNADKLARGLPHPDGVCGLHVQPFAAYTNQTGESSSTEYRRGGGAEPGPVREAVTAVAVKLLAAVQDELAHLEHALQEFRL